MKIQNIIVLVIAILCGVAAVFLTKNYINQQVVSHKEKIDRQYKPVKVVVARGDYQRGLVLTQSHLAVRKVPSGFVHSDAIRPSEAENITGHKLVFSINKGETLLSTHVAYSKGDTFSNLIEEGKRAMTFPVDVLSSLSGMLSPGDSIDLLVTIDDGSIEKTLPLLTNLQVIATGNTVDELSNNEAGQKRFQTVTLHVTPQEAAMITHAEAEGKVTVLLRSRTDDMQLKLAATTKNSLLGKKNKQIELADVGPRIIRAGKK